MWVGVEAVGEVRVSSHVRVVMMVMGDEAASLDLRFPAALVVFAGVSLLLPFVFPSATAPQGRSLFLFAGGSTFPSASSAGADALTGRTHPALLLHSQYVDTVPIHAHTHSTDDQPVIMSSSSLLAVRVRRAVCAMCLVRVGRTIFPNKRRRISSCSPSGAFHPPSASDGTSRRGGSATTCWTCTGDMTRAWWEARGAGGGGAGGCACGARGGAASGW